MIDLLNLENNEKELQEMLYQNSIIKKQMDKVKITEFIQTLGRQVKEIKINHNSDNEMEFIITTLIY